MKDFYRSLFAILKHMDQSLFGLAFIAVFALLVGGIKKLIVDRYIKDKERTSGNANMGVFSRSTLIILFPLAIIGLVYVAYQDVIFIRSIFEVDGSQSWLIALGVVASFVTTGVALAPAILYVVVATKLEREQILDGKIFIYAKYFFMITIVMHILLSLYLVFIY